MLDNRVNLGKRSIKVEDVASKLSLRLTDFFKSEEIERLGRESGFIQRRCTLTADSFVKVLMFNDFDNHARSLTDIVSCLFLEHNQTITKQALDLRFTSRSVLFLKTLLEKFLKEMLPDESKLEQFLHFNSVRIKDSTCFQLPPAYADLYPGSGGSGSKAMIRIQFEYDFKSGAIYDLSAHAFNEQDQTDSKSVSENIQPKDLLIRDLGYINQTYIKAIDKASAYYLNRPGAPVGMYEQVKNGRFKQLDYFKIMEMMIADKLNTIEKDVYLSKEKDIKTRLVIELLPEKEYEKRVRKIKQEAQKKGRNVSKDRIVRARLNLFITNIPQELLAPDKLRDLYRLRWQVELIFKTWKSFSKIHETRPMKIERFNTNLYAKLLLILMNWKILWDTLICYWESKGILISLIKFYKRLVCRQKEITKTITQSPEELKNEILKLLTLPKAIIKLEKKKGKLSLLELILMQ